MLSYEESGSRHHYWDIGFNLPVFLAMISFCHQHFSLMKEQHCRKTFPAKLYLTGQQIRRYFVPPHSTVKENCLNFCSRHFSRLSCFHWFWTFVSYYDHQLFTPMVFDSFSNFPWPRTSVLRTVGPPSTFDSVLSSRSLVWLTIHCKVNMQAALLEIHCDVHPILFGVTDEPRVVYQIHYFLTQWSPNNGSVTPSTCNFHTNMPLH